MLAEAQNAEESLNTLAAVAVKRNCDHFTYSTQMGRQGGSKDRCSFDDVAVRRLVSQPWTFEFSPDPEGSKPDRKK